MIGNIFKWTVIVDEEDIDHFNHVNNASYLKYIQASVTAQWQNCATPSMLSKYGWMATRHEIDYRQQAFLGDKLCVDVLLNKVKGVRSYYDFIIRRGSVCIVEAKSTWCCISLSTQRPVRIREDMIVAFAAAASRRVVDG